MMQKVSYSIKLWHKEGSRYEDLGECVAAEKRSDAVNIFKKKTGWVPKPGTLIVAVPPICR